MLKYRLKVLTPSETTCRNHWHEISGYDPSVARLYHAEGPSRRKARQIAAFARPDETRYLIAGEGKSAQRPAQASHMTNQCATPHSVERIEDKESYPRGFIAWLKDAGELECLDEAMVPYHRYQSYPHGAEQTNHDLIAGMFEGRQATDRDLSSLHVHIEGLLQSGANPNGANSRGETLLHLAVAIGHIPVVTLLLEYGANPHGRTKAGESIWKFAGKASQTLMASMAAQAF